MDELVPGIFHWTAFRESIGMDVHSYWIEPAGVVLDPMVPPDVGLDWWEDRDAPRQVVLTTGLHWRQSGDFVERFGCAVRVAQAGLARWEGDADRDAVPFDFGDEVAPGITAIEIGSLAPDETALHIAHGDGAVALADSLIRAGAGSPLAFVPDYLMGDDPEGVKDGMRQALRGLLDRDFDTLLMAHGEPIVGDAKEAVREFVGG